MKRQLILLCLVFFTFAVFFALIMEGLYGDSRPTDKSDPFSTQSSTASAPTVSTPESSAAQTVSTPTTTLPSVAPNPYLEGMGRDIYHEKLVHGELEVFITSISFPTFDFPTNRELEAKFDSLCADILSDIKEIAADLSQIYLKDAENGKPFFCTPGLTADFEINRIEQGLLSISFNITETNSRAMVESYGKHFNFDFEIDGGITVSYDTLFKANDPTLFCELLCDRIAQNDAIHPYDGYEKILPDILEEAWFLTEEGITVEFDGGEIYAAAELTHSFSFGREELLPLLSEYGERLLYAQRKDAE